MCTRRAMILGGLAGFAPGAAPMAQSSHAGQADAIVSRYAQAGRFSGVVAVASDGAPAFQKAWGLADDEGAVPNTVDTVFRIGSLTKQFTAAAVLQLAEARKLTLSDPISKHYPAVPAAWREATLLQLLNHSAGVPSYTNLPGYFETQAKVDRTPAQVVALTAGQPLDFKPGSRWAYSNTGYTLLGLVIETVSGQAYPSYLRDYVLAPLGLDDTGYDDGRAPVAGMASGYAKAKAGRVRAPSLSMATPYAAGSLYSTASDLLAWSNALQAGKVLSAASLRAMFTDYGFRYGLGQFVETRGGHRCWSHSGFISGFRSALAFFPDQRLTIAILANIEDAPVDHVQARLAKLSFRASV